MQPTLIERFKKWNVFVHWSTANLLLVQAALGKLFTDNLTFISGIANQIVAGFGHVRQEVLIKFTCSFLAIWTFFTVDQVGDFLKCYFKTRSKCFDKLLEFSLQHCGIIPIKQIDPSKKCYKNKNSGYYLDTLLLNNLDLVLLVKQDLEGHKRIHPLAQILAINCVQIMI